MRRIAIAATAILTLALAGPVMAGPPSRCTISVSPAIGSPTDSYRISGAGFPPGDFGSFTDVHIAVGRTGDGRLQPTLALTLFPGGGGSFFVDYHSDAGGEVPAPLAPGRYRIRAEANSHGCRAVASFRVVGVGP